MAARLPTMVQGMLCHLILLMESEPLMAGAAGVGAGAVGGAAAARHQNGIRNRDTDSSLTGRRSWDAGRQPQPPHSILANPAGRRYTGSTNPYVQARDPKKARFSDEVINFSDRRQSHSGHPPNNSYSNADNTGGPPLVSPISNGSPINGSPRHSMPGGWRGSGEWERNGRRASYGNDNVASSRPAATNDEAGWYRGRYMGDGRPAPGSALAPAPASTSAPGDSGMADPADSRFYAQKRASGEIR